MNIPIDRELMEYCEHDRRYYDWLATVDLFLFAELGITAVESGYNWRASYASNLDPIAAYETALSTLATS